MKVSLFIAVLALAAGIAWCMDDATQPTPPTDATPGQNNAGPGEQGEGKASEENQTLDKDTRAVRELMDLDKQFRQALMYVADRVLNTVNEIAGTCGCSNLRPAYAYPPPGYQQPPSGRGGYPGAPPQHPPPPGPGNPNAPGNAGGAENTGADARQGKVPA